MGRQKIRPEDIAEWTALGLLVLSGVFAVSMLAFMFVMVTFGSK